jgi:hypothetical protein
MESFRPALLVLFITVVPLELSTWAAQEEAAAGGRLLTRQPVRAEDLPQHFSTGRRNNTPPFNLTDIGMEFFASACRQTPRNQDGPYCPIVPRIIA